MKLIYLLGGLKQLEIDALLLSKSLNFVNVTPDFFQNATGDGLTVKISESSVKTVWYANIF